MELYEALCARCTVREFRAQPVPEQTVQRVLAAGLLAPSNGHLKYWEFILLRDPVRRRETWKARDGSDSQTNRMTEEQFAEWDRIWRGFQEDLAKRSTHGEFRLAETSGHFIQLDQPDLVIQATRDMLREVSRNR